MSALSGLRERFVGIFFLLWALRYRFFWYCSLDWGLLLLGICLILYRNFLFRLLSLWVFRSFSWFWTCLLFLLWCFGNILLLWLLYFSFRGLFLDFLGTFRRVWFFLYLWVQWFFYLRSLLFFLLNHLRRLLHRLFLILLDWFLVA